VYILAKLKINFFNLGKYRFEIKRFEELACEKPFGVLVRVQPSHHLPRQPRRMNNDEELLAQLFKQLILSSFHQR
jgi:hypothetical protein